MARSKPSVPQTAPAIVPRCSSRLMRITEAFCSVLLGAKFLMSSHPGCKRTLWIWLKGPKCINRSPTWDLVPACIFKSKTLLVVKLFKYIWNKCRGLSKYCIPIRHTHFLAANQKKLSANILGLWKLPFLSNTKSTYCACHLCMCSEEAQSTFSPPRIHPDISSI